MTLSSSVTCDASSLTISFFSSIRNVWRKSYLKVASRGRRKPRSSRRRLIIIEPLVDEALEALRLILDLDEHGDVAEVVHRALLAIAFRRALDAIRRLGVADDTSFRHEKDDGRMGDLRNKEKAI